MCYCGVTVCLSQLYAFRNCIHAFCDCIHAFHSCCSLTHVLVNVKSVCIIFRFIPCDAWIGLVLPPLAGDIESSWTGSERSHTDNHRVWIAVIEQLCR